MEKIKLLKVPIGKDENGDRVFAIFIKEKEYKKLIE